jgi:glutathione S-transferase
MSYSLITANRNYSSWSLRPWLLMRALGIPFAERVLMFEPDNHARFREFAPNAQVPCLIDHRAEGDVTVWDTLAIAEYLAERQAGIWPQDEAARTWARCISAEMHGGFGPLRTICPMNVGVRARLHAIDPALQRNISRIDEIFAGGLARFGGPWLAGERFTAADAFYAPVAFRVRSFALPLSEAAMAWVTAVLAHPAMRDWETQALAETARETAHEEEIAGVATVIADYRADAESLAR